MYYTIVKLKISTVDHFLKNTLVQTIIDNGRSGVSQGSILGPTLFNIYINDFIHTLAHNNVFQYADDCQIPLSFDKKSSFYDIVAKINTTINIAKKWTDENYLCLKTPLLTEILYFKRCHFLEARHYNHHRYYLHRHRHPHWIHHHQQHFTILIPSIEI